MVDNTILKFRYEGALGLLYYFLGDWRTFEGWCAFQGCNPQKIDARRMISLMMYFVEKDMDDKQREQFRDSLENPQLRQKIKQVGKPRVVNLDSTKKWRAPEGWTPPGWNEEKSFAAAQAFMGFQASPK